MRMLRPVGRVGGSAAARALSAATGRRGKILDEGGSGGGRPPVLPLSVQHLFSTENSLFRKTDSLLREKNSLFCCVGNLAASH
jgi:hypothetical protein